MRTARDRRTADGAGLGTVEALDATNALCLYLADGLAPKTLLRRLEVGAPADLVLCAGTMQDVLADLTAERITATVISGELAYSCS